MMKIGRRITPAIRTLIEHYADLAIAGDRAVEIPGHDLLVASDTVAAELLRGGARIDTTVLHRPGGRTAHLFALVDHASLS
jgi:hypothetical protein